MKIFRATAEQTKTLETLVLAKDSEEASFLINKAIRSRELTFEDDYYVPHNITDVHQIDIGNWVIKEVKDYGILSGDKLIYDPNIIEEIAEANKHQMKEEHLKKHHLELKLGA